MNVFLYDFQNSKVNKNPFYLLYSESKYGLTQRKSYPIQLKIPIVFCENSNKQIFSWVHFSNKKFEHLPPHQIHIHI